MRAVLEATRLLPGVGPEGVAALVALCPGCRAARVPAGGVALLPGARTRRGTCVEDRPPRRCPVVALCPHRPLLAPGCTALPRQGWPQGGPGLHPEDPRGFGGLRATSWMTKGFNKSFSPTTKPLLKPPSAHPPASLPSCFQNTHSRGKIKH